MKTLILFTALTTLPLAYGDTKECLSAREYITTVEFMKSNPEFQLKPDKIRWYADKVSTGCTGASSKFIKVTRLLMGVGVDSGSSLKAALEFINVDKDVVTTFIKVFEKTYEEKFLDLDAATAMKNSLRLTANFKGNPENAAEDFESVALYCKNNEGLGLSYKDCSDLAMKVALSGEEFEEENGDKFIKLYEFIALESEGPRLTVSESLKIASDLMVNGPRTFKNFKTSYIYAKSKDGLDLPKKQALELAIKLASRSSLKVPSES